MKLNYALLVLAIFLLASCSKEGIDETDVLEGMPDVEVVECSLKTAIEQNLNESFVKVVPVDGVAPYTYLWSTGVTTQNLDGITSGNYSVEVKDADGCESIQSMGIDLLVDCEGPFGVVVSYNDADSILNADITSAIGYFVNWSNGEQTESISVESGNSYTVDIINQVGCTLTVTYDIP